MGLEKGTWVPPRRGLEGPHPLLYGGKHPFCGDLGCSLPICNQHYAQSYHCTKYTPCARDSPPCTGRVVEYVVGQGRPGFVYFARLSQHSTPFAAIAP